MRSLSRTLAVRFTVTMFAALIVISAAAYLGTARVLRQDLDAGLISALGLQTDALESGQPIAFRGDMVNFDQYARVVNRFIVARTADGAVVSANGPVAASIPWPSGLDDGEIRDTAFVTHEWEGRRIRSLIAHVPASIPRPIRYLQVTASLDPVLAAQDRVFHVALAIIGLAALATFAGGGWLVRSTMAPVAAITAQARTITPETRGKRITAGAAVQEFQGLVAVLNDMLDRLDDGLRVQRRIISDVGHDLRTPITAMRGEIEIALRSKRTMSPEECRLVLQSCLEEIDRLARLSDTLILLARLDSREVVPDLSPVNLVGLVRDRLDEARSRWKDHCFVLDGGVSETLVATVDSRMVTSVIDQLLENVGQHTPAGTTGTLGLSTTNGHVTMSVSDDGPGLSEDTMVQLFDRFFRADEARTRSSNAGLGLTLIAAIAQAHGGGVRAASSDLGGLNVQVTLPIDANAASTES